MTQAQVFSSKFGKIFKNIAFIEHLRGTASIKYTNLYSHLLEHGDQQVYQKYICNKQINPHNDDN